MIPGIFAAGAMGQGGGGGGGGTLFDLIMAEGSLSFYTRHAEASGTTAINETGSNNGTYQATTTLGGTALYSGGPTSVAFSGSSSGVHFPTGLMPSASAMTLMTIMSPAAISGIRMIMSRDSDGGAGNRRFQWRLNGTSIDFIKITGSVQTVTRTHGMSAGVADLIGVTISSTGTVKMFRNGAKLGSDGSVSAADYGGGTLDIRINKRSNTEGTANSYSESCGFTSELSEAKMLAFAQAAGLA